MMKRALDLIVTVVLLPVILPVMAIVAVLVRFRLGRPIFYGQNRIGSHDRVLKVTKFRTMTNDIDERGHLRPDSERLTPLGRRLRRLSLDELPEFALVLKGDMSLVGPRPLPVEYRDRYTPRQMQRHNVKPGITGWAQVNGRNALTHEEKFEMDVWYTENRSLWLDLRILARTLRLVLSRSGISHEGFDTAPEFKGEN